MDYSDFSTLTALALLTASLFALCSAIGGVIAHRKKRQPTEGVLLGLFLGPIGVALETRLPSVPRPEVCEHAWNSFQSVATYKPLSSREARDFPRRG